MTLTLAVFECGDRENALLRFLVAGSSLTKSSSCCIVKSIVSLLEARLPLAPPSQ